MIHETALPGFPTLSRDGGRGFLCYDLGSRGIISGPPSPPPQHKVLSNLVSVMCTGSVPIVVQNMIDARISWMISFLSNIRSTMYSVEPPGLEAET